MKKNYILIVLCVLFIANSFGQSRLNFLNHQPQNVSSYKKLTAINQQQTTNSDWFSYAMEWQNKVFPNGGGNNLFSDYIFPDTLLKMQYGSGFYSAYIHGISTLIEPGVPMFNNMHFYVTKPFTIDSIRFPGIYKRNINNSIPDTLLVELVTGFCSPFVFIPPDSDIYKAFGFYGFLPYVAYTFNPYTLDFNLKQMDTLYTNIGGKPNFVNLYTYKILLPAQDTINDSAWGGGHLFKIPTPDVKIDANGGFLTLAVNIHFIPGYKYVEGDRSNTKNSYQFFSFEEQCPGKYPVFQDGDYNTSYIIPNEALDSNYIDWYEQYVPNGLTIIPLLFLTIIIGLMCISLILQVLQTCPKFQTLDKLLFLQIPR